MKVSWPSTIQGLRQIGTAAGRGLPEGAGSAAQAASAPSSQWGRASPQPSTRTRCSSARACSRVRTSVTRTSSPAARSASRSGARFSSSLAITRSGARAVIAATSGFFVPPIRAAERAAGCVHQSVTPTSSPGAVTATASVSEGTRETTRTDGPFAEKEEGGVRHWADSPRGGPATGRSRPRTDSPPRARHRTGSAPYGLCIEQTRRPADRVRAQRRESNVASMCSATATTSSRVPGTVARQRWRTPPERNRVSPRSRRWTWPSASTSTAPSTTYISSSLRCWNSRPRSGSPVNSRALS